MPRNCFEKIRRHLCLNSCFNMLLRDNPANDKLFKVRPLLDRLANTFRKEYRPSKFVSIDEGMVKYKGRLGFKQYMPTKPVKWGIKVWVHADATNSFVSTMQAYTGKKNAGQPEHGLGHRVVCDLVSNLKGKNYHIFSNNFFTSARLVEDLLSNKLYLCGTTHANRTDFPKDLKAKKPKVKALHRGESLFHQKGNIVASVWKDKKAMAFISTQCNARGGICCGFVWM